MDSSQRIEMHLVKFTIKIAFTILKMDNTKIILKRKKNLQQHKNQSTNLKWMIAKRIRVSFAWSAMIVVKTFVCYKNVISHVN